MKSTRAALAASIVLAAVGTSVALSVDDRAAPPIAFASAEECGRCHRDIHRNWKSSLHAQSADNWRFQDAFERLRGQGNREAASLCTRCHAPAAYYGGDSAWRQKPTWEGVTCDFCHSVTAVQPHPERPFVLNVGNVKTGPSGDVQPGWHRTAYSSVHTSSSLCEPCHQFTNAQNVPVLSTFAEWQASGYPAKNVTCQTCHMRAVSGVNLHEMAGGHSVLELNRAVHATVSGTRRGDRFEVIVQVTNRGAGHMVPTGSPLRSIEMVIEVDSGIGERQRASRTFERVIVDAAGRELRDEAGVWLHGARVVRDTRLAPNDRRTETFAFTVAQRHPARAVAKFFYRYAPDTPAEQVPFLSVNTWVPPAER